MASAILNQSPEKPDIDADAHNRLSGPRKAFFFALGIVMLALGVIGAFLPLMPTTIFLIIAAWAFGRSSTRLERWMLDHPRFGPLLRDWREQGAMPRKAKWMACAGMAVGYAIFFLAAEPQLWLSLVVAAPMIATAVWIIRRPERPALD